MSRQHLGDVDRIDPRLDTITDGLYRVSIKAVIIHDHQLLMSHEPEGWYSLPGGGMKHGSTVEETLKRELEEELGVAPETVRVESQMIAYNFGSVMYGIPRANLYFRAHLTEAGEVRDGELGHLWATAADLDELHLSRSTGKLVTLIKSML